MPLSSEDTSDSVFDAFTRSMFNALARWCDQRSISDPTSPLRWRLEGLDQSRAERKLRNHSDAITWYASVTNSATSMKTAQDQSVKDERFSHNVIGTITEHLEGRRDGYAFDLAAYASALDALHVWAESVIVAAEQESVRAGAILSDTSLANYRSLFMQTVRDVVISLVEPDARRSRSGLWTYLTGTRISRLPEGPLALAEPRSRSEKPLAKRRRRVTPRVDGPERNSTGELSKIDHRGDRYSVYLARDLDDEEVRELARGFMRLVQHHYPDADLSGLVSH